MDSTEYRLNQIEEENRRVDKQNQDIMEQIRQLDKQHYTECVEIRQEIKKVENKVEKLKRAVIIEVPDDTAVKNWDEKKREFDALANDWEGRLTNNGFIIEKIDKKYYLYLTHILRFIELNNQRDLPTPCKIIDNPDSRKTHWTRPNIMDKFSIRIEQLKCSTLSSDLISNMSKIQYFKKPIETSDSRNKIFLVELDSEQKAEKDVIGCFMFNFKGMKITFESFIEKIEDMVYNKKFKEITIEKMEEIDKKILIPCHIEWDNSHINFLHESKRLFLDNDVQKHFKTLEDRIKHFEKINKKMMEDSKILQFPFEEAHAYNKWFMLSGTMDSQVTNFCDRVKSLVEKENITTSEDDMLNTLLGGRSSHEITFKGVVSTLKSFLGFYVGVYYTNFSFEKLIEPDLFSILLTSNLGIPVKLYGSNSKVENGGRGNLGLTVAKKFDGILMIMQSLVTHVVKNLFINAPLLKVVNTNIDDIYKIRKPYYKKNVQQTTNGALGGTAVDNEVSPHPETLRKCYLQFRERILHSETTKCRDIQKLIFLGLAAEGNGFRDSTYKGMRWGQNINTFIKYTQYQLKEGEESRVKKNPYLFMKKILSQHLAKFEDENLCVGIDALVGHLAHKKAHLDSVFIPFYLKTSILFHDTAALILRNEKNEDAIEYLKFRQKDLNDFSNGYKWMEERQVSFVDKMGEKHFGESVFSAQMLDLLREVFTDYNKEVLHLTQEESIRIANNYSTAGLRRMANDTLSDRKIHENVRNMLRKTVLLHSKKIHYNIYDRTNHFLGSRAMRCAREEGFMDDNLNTEANHESLQPYIRTDDSDFPVFDEKSHETLLEKLTPDIISLIKEVESIWDFEEGNILFLFKFKLDNLEENIKNENLDYVHIDFRAPKNKEIEMREDDWTLFDALLVILSSMRENRPDRYKVYQELLKEYVSETEVLEFIKDDPNWNSRQKLMKKYKLTKDCMEEDDSDDSISDNRKTVKAQKRVREEDNNVDNILKIGDKIIRHGYAGRVKYIEEDDEHKKIYTIEYPDADPKAKPRLEDITHDNLLRLLKNKIIVIDNDDSKRRKRN